ncbi:MAG: aldehyde dehydrogenase family protein, partial [Actinomycetota bacterium]
GPRDVDAAVDSARAAAEGWRDMPPARRARLLLRAARVLRDRGRELAVLQSLEAGVPIRVSRDVDAPLAAAQVFHHAGWADKLGLVVPGMRARPAGVAAVITPAASPLATVAAAVSPALACGAAVVLKPAPEASLTALRLAEAFAEAGLPPGVVNVVTGTDAAGSALAAHPGVDVVAFTGSAQAGAEVRRATAGTGARVTVDAGGACVHIVFEDAPLDQAVDGAVDAAFVTRGHMIRRGCRLVVQEGVAGAVLDRLAARLDRLRVGDPLDVNTDVGPVGSPDRRARVAAVVDAAAADGCDVRRGAGAPPGGAWFAPAVIAGGAAGRAARGEVPGPVLTVESFRTEAEAVALANAAGDGLSAGVWTESGARCLWMAGRLRAGVVWANAFGGSDPARPAGGRHHLAAFLDLEPVA